MSLMMMRAALIARNTLPPQYQRVEYITSGGNSYLNTGYIPNGNTRFDLEVECNENQTFCGDGLGSGYNNCRFILGLSASYPGYMYIGYMGYNKEGPGSSTLISFGVKHRMFLDSYNRKAGVDSISINIPQWNATTSGTMYLFARNQTTNYRDMTHPRKIYSYKISEIGVPKKDYIPCRRKSDNVAGFWERVSGEFKISDTVNSFIAGPDIL